MGVPSIKITESIGSYEACMAKFTQFTAPADRIDFDFLPCHEAEKHFKRLAKRPTEIEIRNLQVCLKNKCTTVSKISSPTAQAIIETLNK